MSDPVWALFEQESHRYGIEHHGGALLVSLDNLARAYNRDRDESRIAFFVDTVLGNRFENQPWPEAQPSILFALEPSDHAEPSDLHTPLLGQWRRLWEDAGQRDRLQRGGDTAGATAVWPVPRTHAVPRDCSSHVGACRSAVQLGQR